MADYHHAIFDLLGVAPAPSPERLAAVEARERLCGVRFPESVRAFYAAARADTLFEENSGNQLIPLEEFGDPAETAQGWLRVALENQAVVAWYVRLDAGDDPPVLNNNDEWPDDLSEVDWQQDSQTWTNFIFDTLSWSWGGISGWDLGLSLAARDAALLARLGEALREGPRTETPAIQMRRFYDGTRLLAVRRVTADGAEADWTMEARTPDALASLARLVWASGTLVLTLKAQGSGPNARAKGEAILTLLRGEAP